MGLINSVVSWVFKQRLGQIDAFIKDPHGTQQKVWQELIEKGQKTEWGRVHGFDEIKNPDQYRQRVPIQDYDSLKPYIERIMHGEQQVLWPTDISWFAKSSGTTSDKSKFIPVSQEALDECHYKGGKDLLAVYLENNPESNIFSGKGLVMGGSTEVNELNEDSKYGDVSAVMMSNMPLLGRIISTPGKDITLMEDYEQKINLMAQQTIKKNVTNIVGVPTWTVVLIKKIFELTGKDNLRDIWPNLELYIHGGVSFTPYRDQFNQLIRGEGMHYLETYNASEGFFAIQHKLGVSDLLLMLDYGIYFEFAPLDELEKAHPKTLLLHEVETDTNYALIISTNAGLWRYQIGDTIQFTSTDPYRIRISGRVKHFINAFGEEVIIDNADAAITRASEATHATVKDYTAAPVYFEGLKNGGHEWIIEFEKDPDDFEKFQQVLDSTLKEINSDYEAKRYKDMALGFPKIHMARPGLFYAWLKERGKLGGQHKVPRLSNDRKYVDALLEMLAETSA